MIDFSKKLTSNRLHNTRKRESSKSLLFDFESDRGRIINSAAVRRLQQKTQVFPLERNAAVRSRLTHSLEVQQVGRYIVQSIFNKLDPQKQAEYNLIDFERHLESVVEMACLMHDIGNPPFGHFGEQAINDWFNKNLSSSFPISAGQPLNLPAELQRDICNFEGNAQAIRLIHSLLQLNLTYTQVAGVLKYTRCGTDIKPDKGQALNYLKKKVGFYFSEKNYVQTLCDALEMQVGHRHPASYIMEAADDISYCIADLEDAVEKGILDVEKLQSSLCGEFLLIHSDFNLDSNPGLMQNITAKAYKAAEADDISKESQFFISLRVGVLHPLVGHAVERFIANIQAIFHGSFNQALLEDNSAAHALSEAFKKVALKYAFCNKEVEARELQGYKIINGLLDCYQPLLKLTKGQFTDVYQQAKNAPLLERRLIKKLPNKHLRAYLHAIQNEPSEKLEFYYRCRLLQDYISGMTDQFAYDEYRALMVVD
ncbi:MAG: dGTPase [Paraglaciecola polaris]|uniref:dGTPase n=1 Tax=Paraglaciecola polaris TaxID=222814 RepID=UPI0030037DA1